MKRIFINSQPKSFFVFTVTRTQARVAAEFLRPVQLRIGRSKLLDAILLKQPSKCSARRSTISTDCGGNIATIAKRKRSIPFALHGRRRKSTCVHDIRESTPNNESPRREVNDRIIDIPEIPHRLAPSSQSALELIGFSGPAHEDIVRQRPLVPTVASIRKCETLLQDPLVIGFFASDFGKLNYSEKIE